MIDYKLHTFLTLCETMNYTQAAEKLHITQPAVTQHIRALEAHYGCRLFTYDGRRLCKTPQGELLERQGHAMRYREARLQAQMQGEKIHHLSIGATKTIGEFVIPQRLAQFLADENHTMRVEVDNTERILALIDKGELDFALIEGFFNRRHYHSRLYRKEPFVGVCGADHPFAGKTIGLEQLWAETLFLREIGSGTRNILEGLLEACNHTVEDFRRVVTISNFGLLEQLVIATGGVTFAYAAIVSENPKLAQFTVEGWETYREFNYVYLPGVGAEALIDLFEE